MNLSREISGLVPGLNKKKPAYGNTGLNLNLQKIVPLITQNCTFTRTEKSLDWWQLLFLCFYVSLSPSFFYLSFYIFLTGSMGSWSSLFLTSIVSGLSSSTCPTVYSVQPLRAQSDPEGALHIFHSKHSVAGPALLTFGGTPAPSIETLEKKVNYWI